MDENEKVKLEAENVTNSSQKVKGKNKKITIVLVFVILILVLGIGVCAGILLVKGNTNITNIFNITEPKEQQAEQENEINQTTQNKNENNEIQNDNTTNKENNTTQSNSTSETIKYEKDNFVFYASSKWEYKIEEKNEATLKINSEDKFYEISGKVNGKYETAFSVVITNNQNSYMDSSWEYYGLYNNSKHIFVMRNFVCRDNDGNKYTSEHYEFEKDVIDAYKSLNVNLEVINEWGNADSTKTLVGKYFIKGESGTSVRSYIYYIYENDLYRTSLKDEFPTVILANYAEYMYYSEGDNKIHVHPVGESFMNNIAMEDNFVVYESIDVTSQNSTNSISGTYIRPDETGITEGTLDITNVKENSFDFSINALTVTNMEKRDEGAVNIGGYGGTAIKVEDGKYECVDKEAYEDFGTEYKIIFTLKDNKTFEVMEVFDESMLSSPYCGYRVTLDGTYVIE